MILRVFHVNYRDCKINCTSVPRENNSAYLDRREFRELIRQIHVVGIIIVVHRQQSTISFHTSAAHVYVTDFRAHGCAWYSDT